MGTSPSQQKEVVPHEGEIFWESPGFKCYYKGDILNEMRHGKGTYSCQSIESFVDDGEMRLAAEAGELDSYTGDHQYSKAHGHGKFVWKGGDSYEGQWVLGQFHGQGALISKKSGTVYVGDFQNNLPDGSGTMK